MKMKTMMKLIPTGQTSANLHLLYSKHYWDQVPLRVPRSTHTPEIPLQGKGFHGVYSIVLFLLCFKSPIAVLQPKASWPRSGSPPSRETPPRGPLHCSYSSTWVGLLPLWSASFHLGRPPSTWVGLLLTSKRQLKPQGRL